MCRNALTSAFDGRVREENGVKCQGHLVGFSNNQNQLLFPIISDK